MSEIQFDFTKRFTKEKNKEFADVLKQIQSTISFKISPRGWCYLMETRGYINKGQFDKVDDAINRLRKNGLLPVDFVAEDDTRMFNGVEDPSTYDVKWAIQWALKHVLEGYDMVTPDWWDGEEYYIQMVVEKVDLIPLFTPICRRYHIPIANAKGWSSILQRAEYARRFAEAEEKGLTSVLLYCGDHDPDGLRISDTIRKNIGDLKDVVWEDGQQGYDPENLIIDRFGLDYNFIMQNNFTWIDNLITGSSKNLASPLHPNFKLPYVQTYLKQIGERKCEANVLVTAQEIARVYCEAAINKYIGRETLARFQAKEMERKDDYDTFIQENGIDKEINKLIKKVRNARGK